MRIGQPDLDDGPLHGHRLLHVIGGRKGVMRRERRADAAHQHQRENGTTCSLHTKPPAFVLSPTTHHRHGAGTGTTRIVYFTPLSGTGLTNFGSIFGSTSTTPGQAADGAPGTNPACGGVLGTRICGAGKSGMRDRCRSGTSGGGAGSCTCRAPGTSASSAAGTKASEITTAPGNQRCMATSCCVTDHCRPNVTSGRGLRRSGGV